MAFGLEPSLSLGVKPPQIDDPLRSMEGVMRVQQLAQQGQLAPLRAAQLAGQVQQDQLENEQKRAAIDKAKILAADEESFHQGMLLGDPDKMDDYFKKNMRNPVALSTALQHSAQARLKTQQLTDKQQADLTALTSSAAGRVAAIKGITDPALRTAAWTEAIDWASKTKNPITGKSLIDGMPLNRDTAPDDNGLSKIQISLEGAAGFQARDEARRKQIAEQKKLDTDVAEKGVKLGTDKLKAFASLASTAKTAAEYGYHYNNADEDVQKAAPAPEDFDPDTTPAKLRQMGQTSHEQATTDLTQQQRDIEANRAPGSKAALASVATDPTKTPEQRKAAKAALDLMESNERGQTANAAAVAARFDRREYDTGVSTHRKLQDDIRTGNRLADEFTTAASEPIGSKIVNPKTGKEEELTEATRGFFMRQAQSERGRADESQTDLRDLHKRMGWGEYSPGQKVGSPGTAPTGKGPQGKGGKTPKTFSVGGRSFTEGQTVPLKDGRKLQVTGVENGQLQGNIVNP